jgi:hypothetical protein
MNFFGRIGDFGFCSPDPSGAVSPARMMSRSCVVCASAARP